MINYNDAMAHVTCSIDEHVISYCDRCGNKTIDGSVSSCGDVENECLYEVTHGRELNYTEELRFDK